jgi:cell division protease FtsH
MVARTEGAPLGGRRRLRRLADVVGAVAYVIEVNARRVLVAFGLLLVLVLLVGARDLVDGLFGLVGALPFLAIQLLFASFALIAQFAVLMWFLSRPRKYVVTPDNPQIGLSFDNYRGQPDLLEHARSTVRILQGVPQFRERGGEMPRGMLLSGAPGTGKTFLAACIAAEAKLPFIYIDASSLSSMWFGVDALIVISLFRQARALARKYAPPGHPGACILFMDELDSIGMSRGGVMGGGPVATTAGFFGYGRFALNTLLNQMDSLGQHVEDRWSRRLLRWLGLIRGPVPPKPVVFVIGATNRPEVLDPALTRPGRLDRMLEVYPPDAEGRRDIIEHYLSQKAHDPDIPIDLMVADSIGWTPVMIKTIINEALIVAHDEGREALTYKDWLAAADARTLGLKQPIRQMPEEDRRAIAYHEAGHAVVARYVQPENRILKATIIRRGGALGVVQPRPREERYTRHARQIEADIMTYLGSRAVEEVILGTKMAGASSDLLNATQLALNYCAHLGMGSSLIVVPPAGPLSYPMPVTRMADALLDLLMEETKRLIREKEYVVHAVAAALMEKGELIGPELDAVFEAADRAHPDQAGPFQRRLVVLPKLFETREEGEGEAPTAVADAAAMGPAAADPTGWATTVVRSGDGGRLGAAPSLPAPPADLPLDPR